MTAEIAIMNKEAVALAADSAGTVEIAGEKKIFTSANKLFALSYKHPVGIMVYNNSYFMEVPWETIIKSYRATIPAAGFEKLEDYTNDFLSFLASSDNLFSSDARIRFLINFIKDIFEKIKVDIENLVNSKISQDGRIDDNKTRQIISETIDKYLSSWLQVASQDGFLAEDKSSEVVKKYEEHIKRSVSNVFGKLPLSDDSMSKLFILASKIVAKGRNPITRSGIVLAGFGEKEYFPSLQSFTIDGIADNQVRRSAINTVQISTTMPGQIIPFAQREMVDRFMTGVDPKYQNIQKGYITELCKSYAEKVVANIDNLDDGGKSRLQAELLTIGSSLVTEFDKKMSSAVFNQFILPIFSVISALPKNELAVMAESLVHITSLKRQFSAQEETVKEPIDVVIISKWDGFIWIKRKHYFKPELNQHFLQRGGYDE